MVRRHPSLPLSRRVFTRRKVYFESHPKKKPIFEKELDAQARNVLADICDRFGVQGPDLLVYKPGEHYWFAEVKGPGDRLAENQRQSHTAIRRQLGVEVELISVRIQR